MRDRWVAIFLVVVLIQLPLYFFLGKDAISFDFAITKVESLLKRPVTKAQDLIASDQGLRDVEQVLSNISDPMSRGARVEMAKGVFAWKKGEVQVAIEHLEKSRDLFAQSQGPDSFHVAAVDLRLGELFFFRSRFPEAEVRFQRSEAKVRQYLGPENPFWLRMTFRRVSALTALGKMPEAAKIAKAHLPQLINSVADQDEQFLGITGGSLDALARKSLLRAPKRKKTWKSYLLWQKKTLSR